MSLINDCFAYWPLENGILDMTPNGYNLTPTNVTYGAGGPDFTDMAIFNGASSYCTLPNVTSKLTGHKATVNYWVKIDNDPPTGLKTGITKFSNDGNPGHYPYTDGTVYDSFGSTVRKMVGTLVQNKTILHMVTISVDEALNEWKFYINGALIYQTTAGTWNWSATALIGGYPGVNYLSGRMSQVSLYNAALDVVDISILYNNGKGTFYPFTLASINTNKLKFNKNKKSMFTFTEEQIKTIVHEAYGKRPALVSAHSFSKTSTTAFSEDNLKFAFFGKVVCSTIAQVGSFTVKLEKTLGANVGVNYNAEIPALIDTDLNGSLDIENQLFNKWAIDGSLAATNFYFIGFKIQFD